MEADDLLRAEGPEVGRGSGHDAKAEGNVGHGVDEYTLMGRGTLRQTTHTSLAGVRGGEERGGEERRRDLEDVVAVKEGELSGGLEPDFVARMLGEDVEGRHVELELARLGELAHGRTEGDELLRRRGRERNGGQEKGEGGEIRREDEEDRSRV